MSAAAVTRKAVMLVTNTLHDKPDGGRELLCKLNHDTLQSLYGEGLSLFELPRVPVRNVHQMANAFRGHIDGVDQASLSAALKVINSSGIDTVFMDGSNLGEFARTVKTRCPRVEVVTFFHNAEARFFLGAFKQRMSAKSLSVLLANYLAERKAVRFSDKRIALSQRDSLQLQSLYGRSATHIVAMALRDQVQVAPAARCLSTYPVEPYALFVGGVFYANQAGITWFVEQVVPRIDIKVCIVGRGFEGLRETLERKGKVEVIGAVDSLADWYLNAKFVVAPIFDGSGMKTKVAEALMFGRQVIGTPEAFSGYEKISGLAGVVCCSADEFVAAINGLDVSVETGLERELRAIYDAEYSQDAYRRKIALVLEGSLARIAESERPPVCSSQ